MRIAIKRLVIADAMRKVANIIFSCGLDIFARLCGLVESDQLALTLNICIRDFISDGFLPFFTLFYVGFRVGHDISPLPPVI